MNDELQCSRYLLKGFRTNCFNCSLYASVEKKLADLERELDEKEGWLKDAENKLNDVEDRLDQETRGREQIEGDLLLRTEELYQLREVEAKLAQSEAEVSSFYFLVTELHSCEYVVTT